MTDWVPILLLMSTLQSSGGLSRYTAQPSPQSGDLSGDEATSFARLRAQHHSFPSKPFVSSRTRSKVVVVDRLEADIATRFLDSFPETSSSNY